MASPTRHPHLVTGEAAWQAVATALRAGPPAAEPDDNLLSAWIEGRLDEQESAPVESWIARDPAAATLRLQALREALAAEPPEVSHRLQLRLRAMAPLPRGSSAGGRRLPRLGRVGAQFSAMAAALTLAVFGAYGGYELGLNGMRAVDRAQLLIAEEARAGFGLLADDLFLD